MRRSSWQLTVVLVLALISAGAAAGAGGRALQVKMTYSGKGTVDDQHRIYISVFDTAYIGHQGDAPLATLSIKENGETVSFSDLQKSPVYVFAFYDKAGGHDPASGSAPSGSPAGLYGKQPGIADPIEIKDGQTARIEMTFDDSLTMP